jgi:competence CoiA-like predicted nuclease
VGNKNILICPACNKPYEYCHGEFVSPYFRHKDKCECEDRYSESESQEHINGKRDLYEWIKIQDGVTDAVLEGWLPETKQRPDIMFKYNGKQCVIEYQCSPIASEYVERHELYQAGGIKDIWVLGTDKYLNKKSSKKENRRKVIENKTNYYYDSLNNIFIFGKLEQITKEYINDDLRLQEYTDLNYENQIKNSKITAPIDGTIKELNIKEGSIATPQSPILTLSSKDSFEINTYLLTEDIINVKEGMNEKLVQKRKNGDYEFGGTVKTIAPAAEEKISTLGLSQQKVKVTIIPDEKAPELRTGYSIDVHFTTLEQQNKLVVPKTSIFPYEDGDALWLVKNSKAIKKEENR